MDDHDTLTFATKRRITSAGDLVWGISMNNANTKRTTKKKDGKFIPIGAENYCAAIHRPEGYLVILVDAEGYTKAQTKDLEKEEAGQIYSKVAESGIEEFPGSQITIWTETFDTIQSEFK